MEIRNNKDNAELKRELNIYNSAVQNEGSVTQGSLINPFEFSSSIPPLRFAADHGWISKTSLVLLILMLSDLTVTMLLPLIYPDYTNAILSCGLASSFIIFSAAMIIVYRKSKFTFLWLLWPYSLFSILGGLMLVMSLLHVYNLQVPQWLYWLVT